MTNNSVANHRLGLGPDENRSLDATGTIEWLRRQVNPSCALLPDTARTVLSSWDAVSRVAEAKRQGKEARKEMNKVMRLQFKEDSLASVSWSMRSPTPFAERWVQFWSNHFTVSVSRKSVMGLTGSFEREAIRSHCFERFETLLLAVVRHPAMLLYLDNFRSVGPNSRAGRKQRGLNENLAREIMELHTLGVGGGYSESDVRGFAKVLTGWSVARQKVATDTAFRFRREAHEPGTKVVMGQTVVEGEKGGERLLLFLARHPSTAQFIAKKVATHFVADDPPASLVRRLAKSFEHSGGDLSSLALTLIESPETWAPNREKLKPPKEWILGIARGMGGVLPAERVLRALARLGQSPYTAPSPKGWPDRSEDWMGPEAVLSRLDVAERLGLQMGKSGRVGEAAVSHWLGPRVHISTLNALADTLSPAQQWALLFMSPEFQRR